MIDPRISYAALGLMHNLNPSSSGGVEIDPRHLPSKAIEPTPAVAEQPSHLSLRKGFGRIIRDEAGNVVGVEMADEEVDSIDAGAATEAVDKESEWTGIGAESDWVKALSESRPGDDVDAGVVPGARLLGSGLLIDVDAGVYVELERLAACDTRLPRFTSNGENTYLRRLVGKHGLDIEAMSKDRRLNPSQKTAGELSRAMRKAGGLS